jgi:hypothetical protein
VKSAQESHVSPGRRIVNVILIGVLLPLVGCAGTARPAAWALQRQGWSLGPSLRAYEPGCRAFSGGPRWTLETRGGVLDLSDYALLGTGDGTLDFAPREARAGAESYAGAAATGTRRLTGIPTPLVKELVPTAEAEAFVRLYLRGGGVLDARWVVREATEAHGVDLLGRPFRIPNDTITLAQGRQAAAGLGAGRVGMRVTDAFGDSRIDYGLDARIRREREAASALAAHGVVRIDPDDLRRVRLGEWRLSALPARLIPLVLGAPQGIARTAVPAFLVSLSSILAAPVWRSPAGAQLVSRPGEGSPRIGKSGVKKGRLWIDLLPPAGTGLLWVLPEEGAWLRSSGDGEARKVAAVGAEGEPLSRPQLLDPVAGCRIYFDVSELPDRFELVVAGLWSLDGTETGRWVYKMERTRRVRWNPVDVWRDWVCDDHQGESDEEARRHPADG